MALPLVQSGDLTYVGAARLPDDSGAIPNFDYSGAPIVFDDADGGLYVGGREGGANPVAKLKLPPWGTGAAGSLPKATFLQKFIGDVTNGQARDVTGGGDSGRLSGLGITPDGRLLVNVAIDYDAGNLTRKGTMLRSLQLADTTSGPLIAIADPQMQGHTAGECIVQIPVEYRAALGGTMLTGSHGRSIISRGSAGPAAFVFDHKQIDGRGVVPGKALIDYPPGHRTLGDWERDPTPFYGTTDQAGGCVIVPGTRSLLFFGRHGYGKFCYGPGTTTQALDMQPIPGTTDRHCYDPTASAKGQHGYPYRYYVWAYDLDRLALVNAGQLAPWDITPYAVWPFDLPMRDPNLLPQINGVAYIKAARQIVLGQREGNPVTFGSVLHALQHRDFGGVVVPPVDPPPPPPVDPPPVEPPPVDPPPADVAALEARIAAKDRILTQAIQRAPRSTPKWLMTALREALKA